jgi:hypothetical protein
MLQASTTYKFSLRIKATDFILQAVNITKLSGFLDMIPRSMVNHTDVSDERAASIFGSKRATKRQQVLPKRRQTPN